jgi:hypothetical protein
MQQSLVRIVSNDSVLEQNRHFRRQNRQPTDPHLFPGIRGPEHVFRGLRVHPEKV